MKTLNDDDNPGEDHRRDSKIESTILMETWSTGAHELHVKDVLENVEEDYQQEGTHCLSYYIEKSIRKIMTKERHVGLKKLRLKNKG